MVIRRFVFPFSGVDVPVAQICQSQIVTRVEGKRIFFEDGFVGFDGFF
ncbi:MAG: hypothetical protein ACE5PV_27495 [Candidatus Poribacteria bacterium]